MANMMGSLISMAISAIMLSGVFIATIHNTNQSYVCVDNATAGTFKSCGWGASEISLWGTISLVAIAGFIYGVLGIFGLI